MQCLLVISLGYLSMHIMYSHIHRSCDWSLNRGYLHRQRRYYRQITQVVYLIV